MGWLEAILGKIVLDMDNLVARCGSGLPERGRADCMDLLRSRAEALTGPDKALIEMYLESGKSFGQIAQVLGVSRATIGRRVGRLMGRLLGGAYLICLRDRRTLGKLDQSIARDHIVSGLSQSQIAAKRGVSIYRVRQVIGKIEKLVKVARGD